MKSRQTQLIAFGLFLLLAIPSQADAGLFGLFKRHRKVKCQPAPVCQPASLSQIKAQHEPSYYDQITVTAYVWGQIDTDDDGIGDGEPCMQYDDQTGDSGNCIALVAQALENARSKAAAMNCIEQGYDTPNCGQSFEVERATAQASTSVCQHRATCKARCCDKSLIEQTVTARSRAVACFAAKGIIRHEAALHHCGARCIWCCVRVVRVATPAPCCN